MDNRDTFNMAKLCGIKKHRCLETISFLKSEAYLHPKDNSIRFLKDTICFRIVAYLLKRISSE